MIRTLDPTVFNEIANHPEVAPWMGREDATVPIRLDSIVGNPANLCVLTEGGDGGFVLLRRAAGLFEAHSLALPGARGRPMIELMHFALHALFTTTDAMELWTVLPDRNVGARALAKAAGFSSVFRREGFFPLMDERVGADFARTTWLKWALASAACKDTGERFHDALEASTGRVDHAPDAAHDAVAGAAISCGCAGMVEKGVAAYNLWAVVAGYKPVSLLSSQPALVAWDDVVLTFSGGEYDILGRGPSQPKAESGTDPCPPLSPQPEVQSQAES